MKYEAAERILTTMVETGLQINLMLRVTVYTDAHWTFLMDLFTTWPLPAQLQLHVTRRT
jgi:hypothetical protein